ncbi:hypothetical protein ACTHPH_05405 [Paenibacillus pasadenensis]|uniref:Lipoprotein n=1 Tax=Paenibacillus pasadenensis TaxID=217090 RepID=A0A2N5ND45_9BACL|nr:MULTISPECIES: hypothetical protein [Paenibacillus]PLT48276.1 hypothetical protein B8V81_0408 [Paenibacillus pasadenensis]QGG58227.1 hypothetical protein GE073_23370 [Paenibacillus sp. B01]
MNTSLDRRPAVRSMKLLALLALLSTLLLGGCNFTSPVTDGWKSRVASEGLDIMPGKANWKKLTYRVTLENVSGSAQDVEWVEPVLKSNLLLNDPDRSLRKTIGQTVEDGGRLEVQDEIEFDSKNVNLGSSQNVEYMRVKLKGKDEPIEVNV